MFRPGLVLPEPAPLWAELVCGCGATFTGNAARVPCFNGTPSCRACWDQLNRLRIRANLDPWQLPDNAYPTG
jgi:hypothetical protein